MDTFISVVAGVLVVIAVACLIRFQLAVGEFPTLSWKTLARQSPDPHAERLRRQLFFWSGAVVVWSWVFMAVVR